MILPLLALLALEPAPTAPRGLASSITIDPKGPPLIARPIAADQHPPVIVRIEPPDASGGARPVGSYPPNAWGLHDMHGNVAEWMGNHYHPSNRPLLTIDDQGYFIVSFEFPVRGGGWTSPAVDCRSARRDHGHSNVNGDAIGFRVVFEEPDHGSDE